MAKYKCKQCTQGTDKVNKAGLCDKCRLKEEAALKIAQQKAALEQKKKEEEGLRKQMALDAEKKRKTAQEKAQKVTEIANDWRAEVKEIVDAVIKIRNAHPEHATTINAGKNGTYGTTLGGTDNPLVLTLPSPNPYNILKSDVLAVYKPDNSDSGFFKFRHKNGEKDIMVHCK